MNFKKISYKIACLSVLMMGSALAMDVKKNDLNAQLLSAATRRDTQQVKQLISDGADVNAQSQYGDTALILAAANGRKEICCLLLANRAHVNARNRYGDTALILAAATGRKEIWKLLIYAMLKPTKEQKHRATILLGNLNKKQPKAKDTNRLITKKYLHAESLQENKPIARTEIDKIKNPMLKQELLNYLDSIN
jgi:ankyrin repeat protein